MSEDKNGFSDIGLFTLIAVVVVCGAVIKCVTIIVGG